MPTSPLESDRRPRRAWLRRAAAGAGMLCVLAAALGYAYRVELYRLWGVLTLFERDRIVENFRHMDGLFPSRPIRRGGPVFEFARAPGDLPETFEYEGETLSVEDFLEETWTTGLLVVKDDRIVFEEYYRGNTEDTLCISWSVGKSFVSALVGIAVAEGSITDVYDPVTQYAPELRGSGYDGVPLKHVLQMSSGIKFDEDYGAFFSDINRMGRVLALGKPLGAFVASLRREREPGTFNHYVSMDTQVIGMVLTRATGRTLSSYLEEKLWQRIGMESDAYWILDGTGMELAFGGLNVTLRDYARFGRLYLREGNWNGEQIVPAQWVHDSVTPDAPHLQPGDNPLSDWVMGYGYQWWIPEHADGEFMAMGVYLQSIYVSPKDNLVIVKTSAYPDYTEDYDKELVTVELYREIARHLRAPASAAAAAPEPVG